MQMNTNTVKTMSGKGLSHRKLDKRQRAIVAANVCDGLATVELSARQIADVLNVSISYVWLARQLSAEKRSAILAGKDATSFTGLTKQLVLPAPKRNGNGHAILDDAALLTMVRSAGVDRVLDAAAKVDSRAVI
jgi:hypothetical protein